MFLYYLYVSEMSSEALNGFYVIINSFVGEQILLCNALSHY